MYYVPTTRLSARHDNKVGVSIIIVFHIRELKSETDKLICLISLGLASGVIGVLVQCCVHSFYLLSCLGKTFARPLAEASGRTQLPAVSQILNISTANAGET